MPMAKIQTSPNEHQCFLVVGSNQKVFLMGHGYFSQNKDNTLNKPLIKQETID